MNLYLENIESDLNKSTNVNTAQASDTKYPSVKAVFDWATNLFFPKPNGTTSEYLRGDGSVATFPTIPSITGLVPETRTINGLDLSANRTLTAGDVGAVATNTPITGATKTKITYDAKGLVTAGADATTADIADSSNKRYVTDAQLTVIGNTSGTNSGDETQSSILAKLGWFQYNRVSESTAVTGVTTETIIENITIPANTYVNGGILKLHNMKVRKVGANGVTTAMKIYIGPNSNNLSGATQIGVLSSSLFAGTLYFEMLRTFTCTISSLIGFAFNSSTNTDIISSSIARSSVAVDWSVTQYIMITIQPANVSDSFTLIGASAQNF